MTLGLEEYNTYVVDYFKHYRLHHGKEAPFLIKVMVKFIIFMVKVFEKVPSFVCVGDACKPYQLFPSTLDDGGLIRGCTQMDAVIITVNAERNLLDGKGRSVGMNTTIVTTSGSYTSIGFAVPVDWSKPATEDIV